MVCLQIRKFGEYEGLCIYITFRKNLKTIELWTFCDDNHKPKFILLDFSVVYECVTKGTLDITHPVMLYKIIFCPGEHCVLPFRMQKWKKEKQSTLNMYFFSFDQPKPFLHDILNTDHKNYMNPWWMIINQI